MPDTGKHSGHDTPATLPNPFGIAFMEGTESMLHAHAGMLADLEESVINSLRTQREALKKTLEMMETMRDNGTITDHVKMQLQASERWFNSSLEMWREAAGAWSNLAMRRFDSAGKAASSAAEESRRSWEVVERASTGKPGKRTAEAA